MEFASELYVSSFVGKNGLTSKTRLTENDKDDKILSYPGLKQDN